MNRSNSDTTVLFLLALTIIFMNLAISSSHHATVIASHRLDKRNVFHAKHNASERQLKAGVEKPSITTNEQDAPRTRPHFSTSKKAKVAAFDPAKYVCFDPDSPECINKTHLFKSKVISEFRRVVKESFEKNDYYQVQYERTDNVETELCRLTRANVRTVSWRDTPFNWNEIGSYLPLGPLFNQTSATCAVIASSGSLKGSKLGEFIDQHDIVMRFNNAPTSGFEDDVGAKTTVRVVNSQVVTKPEFKLLTAKLFTNISIAAWDPGKFNQSLSDWIKSPDFNLFDNFKRYNEKYPGANFHLVDPRSIWRAWTALQDKSKFKIMRNPPTSGFIGLGLLLPACRSIDMIEYIPSSRMNGLCHYYDTEINSACTFGSWHPLAAEKLYVLRMNTASDYTTFQRGIVRITLDVEGC
ncbi:beta-galactoside alpha-2,6-sialyltransferase 2 [Toxorhynchites rutilus septentrionalis]|uniref:beta-galactoside alpha-2,6-sialyltransferase 2 n=1 Tax=Toxorhynchites rutilus septentrionalis TaxID=329112 RepID=UPI002479E2CE|nr:beta-galactoside alpha-2,6-sialyltransferase 2 [Toxorhynchites rutilus septentrionalis]XP_055630184.1 beta-galactoside alpha-2,6-sialyltransferase 2 [Toxorhynchites rutilus septentrionalis]XP_055630185.1 beta-galactoside alpha-2,6-sialyltransferase 2 [Toxorhynchites rutilus septentrionalis]XP_055630187.1 beta-galactoside alpha-2,6-sialyltransferase 2 [Toxorhynchites rutilus septentrionalis]XP_055630188.1 beta-galactoside alpha-2,6-sialyltransferase 2 [Toxorhynchites rutilus septentrionalis]